MGCNSKNNGFTVIEMLVTVVVGSTFAFMFYQLFISSIRFSDTARRDAVASEIAYSNLSKYPNTDAISSMADCTNPSSTETTTATNSYSDIGSVEETISITWPYACSNPDIVKITSSVSYKSGASTVQYVIYLN